MSELIDADGYLTMAGAARVEAILDAAGVPRRPQLHASRQKQTPARVAQQGQWRKYKVGKGQAPAQSSSLAGESATVHEAETDV